MSASHSEPMGAKGWEPDFKKPKKGKKMKIYAEALAGGMACYSDTSGKIEMVGWQNTERIVESRVELGRLIREGAKRLEIPVWTELDEDYESLVVTFHPKDEWGIFAYPSIIVDEDIDGTTTRHPGFELYSFYRTPNLRQLEETPLSKTSTGKPVAVGLVVALRLVLHWLYENHHGDIVEGVVVAISPKE